MSWWQIKFWAGNFSLREAKLGYLSKRNFFRGQKRWKKSPLFDQGLVMKKKAPTSWLGIMGKNVDINSFFRKDDIT